MFSRFPPRRALCAFAAAASLAGCTTGLSTPPLGGEAPPGVLARIGPDAQHYGDDWLYTTQPGGNDATVYRRKGSYLNYYETLSVGLSAPHGIVATQSGWLYIANAGDSDVLVYRSTKKGPVVEPALNDSGEVPINVAVTPNRKLVAVSNTTNTSSGTGSVSVYLNRADQPSRILTYGSDLLAGEGVAIDGRGDCYWSFDDLDKPSSPGEIVEFSECSGAGTLVASGLTLATGMVFDQNGNLYYIDQAKGIYKCSGITDCKLFATGFGLPVSMNFDAHCKDLWVADAAGYIDVVNPTTGKIELQLSSLDGDPYGVAPSPGS